MEALLAYYTDGARVATATLPRGAAAIGSGRGDWLAVAEQGIEPGHVVLAWQMQRVTWEISRRAPGGRVEVNGRALGMGETLPLAHLDEITVGQTGFLFHLQPAAPSRRGTAVTEIVLGTEPVVLGRASAAAQEEPGTVRIDLDADDRSISRKHAALTPEAGGGWLLEAHSGKTELNGRAFSSQRLVLGDRFRIQGYSFEFTGRAVVLVDRGSGGRITADALAVRVPGPSGPRTILSGVTMEIRSGEFVGILGGSGMGKSTLLKALCGLMPVAEGRVLVDGAEVADAAGQSAVGFVPQDDIVHSELTVRQALHYSARLRLKAPASVLDPLVEGAIARMGLQPQADQRIASLSGGQRKRVNIATELLTRPPVLLLDEPSSGLDPANEEELMTLLQNLSLTGQTVICCTHVLHKAYLFDRISYVHGGQLMFMGTPAEARRFFLGDDSATGSGGSVPLEKIYAIFSRGTDQTVEWQKKFAASPYAAAGRSTAPPPLRLVPAQDAAVGRPGNFDRLRVLLARQWTILRSDRLNLIFLAAQATVIGVLAAWVGHGQPEFRMFLAMIATLWFGTNNAAQQMTREIPVFRRERVGGLGLSTYLHSKGLFLTACTLLQSVLLLLCMNAVLLVTGSAIMPPSPTGAVLQGLSLLLTSATGVGIGLGISALARSSTQAAIWVPLMLIPQILFAGFVVPLADMPASVRFFSHLFPSASAQRLMDAGNIHARELPVMTHNTRKPMFWETVKVTAGDGTTAYEPSYLDRDGGGIDHDDIAELNHLSTAWQNLTVDHSLIGKVKIEEGKDVPSKKDSHDMIKPVFTTTRADLREGSTKGPSGNPQPLTAGEPFRSLSAAVRSLILLIAWVGLSWFVILLGLRRRDPLRRSPQP